MITMERECLSDVACSVLESTVFAQCEVMASPPEMESGRYVKATIRYTGNRNGTLTILTSSELCSEWSDMMLDSDSDSSIHDVLGEIANIIGGNLISRITVPNDQVRLQPPKVCEAPSAAWPDDLNAIAVWLSVDNHPFGLQLEAQDQ